MLNIVIVIHPKRIDQLVIVSSNAVCDYGDSLVTFSYEATRKLYFFDKYPQDAMVYPLYGIAKWWEVGRIFSPMHTIRDYPFGLTDFIVPGEKYKFLRCLPYEIKRKAHLALEKSIGKFSFV